VFTSCGNILVYIKLNGVGIVNYWENDILKNLEENILDMIANENPASAF
jgi:hypothetical protein